MIGLDQIRDIAMSLPQVVEGPPVQSARRIAAFKVSGKSFLGVGAGERYVMVSLPYDEASALAVKDPIWPLREFGATEKH